MKKVTITLPNWIGQDEAQDMVVRDLRAHALLKLEFYQSKMKPFEAKYWQTRCSCAGITLLIILKSPPIRITSTTGSA